MDLQRALLIQGHLGVIVNAAGNIEQFADLTADWIIRNIGDASIFVFLTDPNGKDGALEHFMTYEPSKSLDNDELQKLLTYLNCGELEKGKIISMMCTKEGCPWIIYLPKLKGQHLMAIPCLFFGNVMGLIVVFRKGGFSDEDREVLEILMQLFPTGVMQFVSDDDSDEGDTPSGGLDEYDSPSPRTGKGDPSDWWKRGEDPPF